MAYTIAVLGIIASVIGAIVLWAANSRYNNTVGTGLIVLFGGCIGSWVGGFFTYGFGELIEQQTMIASRLSDLCSISNNSSNAANAPASKNDTSRWTCSKCGHKNPENQMFCSVCGRYK